MINIGQVGIGAWGQNLFRNFISLKNCHLKICCDANPETLRKIKDDYKGDITTTQNFDDLLKDSQLDAVVVSTPAISHFEHAFKAINAGKHVFVEKPLCLSARDAEELVSRAQAKKKILMVGHLLLYHPAVRKLKEIIKSGELGNIFYLYSAQ